MSSIRFKDFIKVVDLRRRILLTLFIIAIYRFVLNIQLIGVNPIVMEEMMKSSSLLGIFSTLSGGGLERFSIFALGISPYVTSSIVIQLLSYFIPSLKILKNEGESGRRIINQYTRYLTIVITTIQAYSMSVIAEKITNPTFPLVTMPGALFRFITVISVLVGTLILMWLGEQITSRGLGQGSSIIIYAGILSSFPAGIFKLIDIGRNTSVFVFFIVLAIVFSILYTIVLFERAYRKIHIIYPKRVSNYVNESYIPMKVNVAGIMPPIFANMIVMIPAGILSFFSENNILSLLIYKYFNYGSNSHMIITALLVLLLSYLYTPIAFDTAETAENLAQNNAYARNFRPRKSTEIFLHTVLMRLTCIGSIYLIALITLPEFVSSKLMDNSIYISGTSFLIVVSVTLDIMHQIYSYITRDRYSGIKKLI